MGVTLAAPLRGGGSTALGFWTSLAGGFGLGAAAAPGADEGADEGPVVSDAGGGEAIGSASGRRAVGGSVTGAGSGVSSGVSAGGSNTISIAASGGGATAWGGITNNTSSAIATPCTSTDARPNNGRRAVRDERGCGRWIIGML